MTLAAARELRQSLEILAAEVDRVPREHMRERGRVALCQAQLQTTSLVHDCKASRARRALMACHAR